MHGQRKPAGFKPDIGDWSIQPQKVDSVWRILFPATAVVFIYTKGSPWTRQTYVLVQIMASEDETHAETVRALYATGATVSTQVRNIPKGQTVRQEILASIKSLSGEQMS
ncbi:hypothetical protein SCUP234_03334 [Seiridium cupressi]